MLNVGEPVICKQELEIMDILQQNKVTFIEGKVYNIEYWGENQHYITINSVIFSVTDVAKEIITNVPFFYDYFLTKAEWRDKQINSILYE